MSILFVVQVALILSVYGLRNANGSSCDSDNCITCVSTESIKSIKFKWCPSTNKCHDAMSAENLCPSGGMVSDIAFCYATEQGVYSPASAYINVLFSAVAYSDHPEQCLNRLLPSGGFRLVAVIGRKCHSFLFKYKECFAAVLISDYLKLIVVTHRGTTSTKQLTDEMLQTVFIPKKNFRIGGKVQNYFKNAFDKTYSCMRHKVRNLLHDYPTYSVAVTGHSLGGAIASLAAASLVHDNIVPKDKMTRYTFGQPRVGDRTYARAFDRIVGDSWRVVHSNDYVARLPTRTNPRSSYTPTHHKKEIYYPNDDMNVDAFYKNNSTRDEDQVASCVNSNPFNILSMNKDYHLKYFNLHVGKACSNIGLRRKRSEDGEEISAMSSLFSNETCKVIRFKETSGQNVLHVDGKHVFFSTLVAVIFINMN